jgi:hypothetical protein
MNHLKMSSPKIDCLIAYSKEYVRTDDCVELECQTGFPTQYALIANKSVQSKQYFICNKKKFTVSNNVDFLTGIYIWGGFAYLSVKIKLFNAPTCESEYKNPVAYETKFIRPDISNEWVDIVVPRITGSIGVTVEFQPNIEMVQNEILLRRHMPGAKYFQVRKDMVELLPLSCRLN